MPSGLRDSTKKRLVKAVDRAVKRTTRLLGADHVHKGGYFRLFTLPNPTAGHTRLEQLYEGWVGGRSNIEGYAKYQVLSFEKALRLSQMGETNNHVSAWESRDLARSQYGGAVLLYCTTDRRGANQTYFILSFSGLPEFGDEAAMLLTATTMWKVKTNLNDITRVSGNELAWKLLDVSF